MSEAQVEDAVSLAEAAREKIRQELSRLQAQLKGLETKIAATAARLEGADEMLAAMKPKKGSSAQ